MTDQIPQFETEDLKGSVDSYESTVGTSLAAVPAAAGTVIQSFSVISAPDQLWNNVLYVYLDGGTNIAAEMFPGGFFSGPLRGDKKQIHIKGSAASVKYKITLNREVY